MSIKVLQLLPDVGTRGRDLRSIDRGYVISLLPHQTLDHHPMALRIIELQRRPVIHVGQWHTGPKTAWCPHKNFISFKELPLTSQHMLIMFLQEHNVKERSMYIVPKQSPLICIAKTLYIISKTPKRDRHKKYIQCRR